MINDNKLLASLQLKKCLSLFNWDLTCLFIMVQEIKIIKILNSSTGIIQQLIHDGQMICDMWIFLVPPLIALRLCWIRVIPLRAWISITFCIFRPQFFFIVPVLLLYVHVINWFYDFLHLHIFIISVGS